MFNVTESGHRCAVLGLAGIVVITAGTVGTKVFAFGCVIAIDSIVAIVAFVRV